MRIGIDLGGTTVKAALCTEDGTLLCKDSLPTQTGNAAGLKADMKTLALSLCRAHNCAVEDVTAIGIGVPGSFDKKTCTLRFGTNLGLNNVSFADAFLPEFGCPVHLDNDANCAALGEATAGAAKGTRNMLMVTLGTGVGGGIIIDEKIIAGKHGLGGEIGHIHVRDEEWEHCNCGGVGCVEQIASATGIAREARRRMAAEETPSALRQYGDDVTAKDVLDAAKAGDELALSVVETVGRYLGLTLATIAMTVDPQMFVIGGGVSKAGQFLIDIIDKYYQHYTPISENKGIIGLAKLGNDAGIYGAARLVLD